VNKWDYLGLDFVEVPRAGGKENDGCCGRLKEAMNDEKIVNLISRFDSECPLDIECVKCDDPAQLGWAANGKTRVCIGKHADQESFNDTVWEELFHSLQDCGRTLQRPDFNDSCKDCLCKEIQAKANSPWAPRDPKGEFPVDKDGIAFSATASCQGVCARLLGSALATIEVAKSMFDECANNKGFNFQ
jgi:hypothetical protein